METRGLGNHKDTKGRQKETQEKQAIREQTDIQETTDINATTAAKNRMKPTPFGRVFGHNMF